MARSYGYSAKSAPEVSSNDAREEVERRVERDLRDEPRPDGLDDIIEENDSAFDEDATASLDRDDIQNADEKKSEGKQEKDDEIVDEFSANMKPKTRRIGIIVGVIVGVLALLLMGYLALARTGILNRFIHRDDYLEQGVDDYIENERNLDWQRDGETQQDGESTLEAETGDKEELDEAALQAIADEKRASEADKTEGSAETKSEGEKTSDESADAKSEDSGKSDAPKSVNDELTSYDEGYSLSEGVADTSGDTLVIRGKLRNDTEDVHENVSLGLYLMDQNGTVVGLAVASTDKVEPGAVWEWEAKTDVETSKVFRFEKAEVRF